MPARFIADLVLLVHMGFILFAVCGGLLAIYRPGLAWVHLPCVGWGIWIETSGGICPLTPLENHFRIAAGQTGYTGGCIEHYLLPLIYPPDLTPNIQLLLAVVLITLNVLFYLIAFHKIRGKHRRAQSGS